MCADCFMFGFFVLAGGSCYSRRAQEANHHPSHWDMLDLLSGVKADTQLHDNSASPMNSSIDTPLPYDTLPSEK